MQNLQNQTDPPLIASNDPQALGTGIFVIPDISSPDADAVEAFYKESITYQQCLGHGALALVFKWTPKPWDDLKGHDCKGLRCVQTCPPLTGCVCYNGVCVKPVSSLP